MYRIKSTNEHGVHSPFVFDLVTQVVYNDKDYYSYKAIELLREKLFRSDKLVNGNKVSELAGELKPVKYGRLLFRLVNYFQPKYVLKIGESIDLVSAYLAAANSQSEIMVVEESQEIIAFVKENLKPMQLKNISYSDKVKVPDDSNVLVYISGNTSKQVLLQRFYQCLAIANDSSVFVISDICSSSEIKDVWLEIKNHKRVKVTVDLFYLGIVFFRKEQVKEHFLIRF